MRKYRSVFCMSVIHLFLNEKVDKWSLPISTLANFLTVLESNNTGLKIGKVRILLLPTQRLKEFSLMKN
jgi:hypothetical protein